MSLQELHVKALEEQVVNLTRDCHYLISLLNQSDEIDWENWSQGKKIKEDLEHSKDFFDAMKHQQDRFDEYDKEQKLEEERRQNWERRKAEFQRQQEENIRKAKEELERSRVNTFSNVQKQKGMNYTLGDYISDLFDSFAYIPPLP